MKKISSIFLACVGVIAIVATLFSAAPPTSVCMTSTYYTSNIVVPIWTGKIDTIAGATTDTFKLACGCSPKFITFSNDCWKAQSTTTVVPTITVALYESANAGLSYGTAPIATYTITPSALYTASVTNNGGALTNIVTVNATGGGGNPGTSYMWVATGAASNTIAWQGSALVGR